MIAHFRKHLGFYLILIAGLLVRVLFIKSTGLSNDELSAWNRTSFENWSELCLQGVKLGDMHPVFYQGFLWVWIKFFGDSELSIRLTSVFFFLLNSLLIYRTGDRFFSRSTSLIILTLYAGLSFLIINSVFARPYNSGTFFLLLAFFGVLSLDKNSTNWLKWGAILTLGFLGAMTSHYFAFLVAGIIGLSGIFYLKGKSRWVLIFAGLAACVGFIPHLSITMFQLEQGGLGWLPKPGLDWPFSFLYQFFNYSVGLLLMVFSIYIIFLIRSKQRCWSRQSTVSLIIAVFSFLLGFFLSHIFTPVLRDLVMLFIMPFLLFPLLNMIEFRSLKEQWFGIGLLFVLTVSHSLFFHRLLEPIHYADFKVQANFIQEKEHRYGKDSIEYALNYNDVNYLNYYLKRDLSESIKEWGDPENVYLLASRASKSQKPYFCYSVANDFDIPMYQEVIRKYYPIIEESKVYPFSKSMLWKKGDRKLGEPFKRVVFNQPTVDSLEYLAEDKTKIKELPVLTADQYYMVNMQGIVPDSGRVILVATLERNNAVLMHDEFPVMYYAYDQSRLVDKEKEQQMFSAFTLPKNAQPNDVIKVFLWNMDKQQVVVTELSYYKISMLK